MKVKFNWKLPLYGVIGFLIGGIVLIGIKLYLEVFILGTNLISTTWIGIICFALWGALGSAILGIGLFGYKNRENKKKILQMTLAGAAGLPLGFIAAIFFLGFLYNEFPHYLPLPGDLVIFVFAVWLAYSGAFLGLGLKSLKSIIYLLFAGAVAGAVLGIITAIFGIADETGMPDQGIPWFVHIIISSAVIGFSFGLITAHIKNDIKKGFASLEGVYEDYKDHKDYKKWALTLSVIGGIAVLVIMNILFPLKVVEHVCPYSLFDCYGKIVTTNKFGMDLYYIEGAWFYPFTYIEYTKNGKRFKASFYIDDMRPSLEWINRNTEKDSVFLSWLDYGHLIRGYSGRDSVVYNPSGEYFDRIFSDEAGEIFRKTWNVKNAGELSSHDKLVDAGYALLTSNPDETLGIMDKYNANYLYIHHTETGKSGTIYKAIEDEIGDKLKFNFSVYDFPNSVRITEEEHEEISKIAKNNDERNELMNELYRKKNIERHENTTIGKALNKEKIEGLELVYSDRSAVIYRKI